MICKIRELLIDLFFQLFLFLLRWLSQGLADQISVASYLDSELAVALAAGGFDLA
jgi:hypothetical protein